VARRGSGAREAPPQAPGPIRTAIPARFELASDLPADRPGRRRRDAGKTGQRDDLGPVGGRSDEPSEGRMVVSGVEAPDHLPGAREVTGAHSGTGALSDSPYGCARRSTLATSDCATGTRQRA